MDSPIQCRTSSRRRTAKQLERKCELDRETQRAKRESDRERLHQLQDDMKELQMQMAGLQRTLDGVLRAIVHPPTRDVSATPQLAPTPVPAAAAAATVCVAETNTPASLADYSHTSCRCRPQRHVSYAECFERTVYLALMEAHSGPPALLHSPAPIPRIPALEDLLFRGDGQNVVTRVMNKMLRFDTGLDMATLLSAYLLVYWVLRYRFFPSPETLNGVPEWLRPTETQTNTPHFIFTDFVHFPRLRDALTVGAFDYVREEFDIDYAQSISVNWPSWQPLFLWQNCEVILNPDFAKHVTIYSNWSLDTAFARKYPEMARLATIRGP
ncbi:hypothetical protein BJX62DRAFT_245264 [Aspergillus germanicus]